MIGWRRLVFAWLAAAGCGLAQADALRIDLGSIEHAAFSAQGVVLRLAGDAGSAEVSVRRFKAGELLVEDLRFSCAEVRIALPTLACRGGELFAAGLTERVQLDVEFDPLARAGRLRLVSSEGDRLDVRLDAEGNLEGEAQALDLGRIDAWVPEAGFSMAGRFDGRIEAYIGQALPLEARFDGRIGDASFSSADGLQAAEGVVLELVASVAHSGGAWDFSMEADWSEGEAYVHPVYTTAGARMLLRGRAWDDALELTRASLAIDGVDVIEARALVTLPDLSLIRLAASVAGADLAAIGPRFIAPLMAPGRPESLGFEGRLSAGITVEDGEIHALDLVLDEVRFVDADAALAFGPLSGVVPWREHERTEASLRFEGGRWEKIELGGFDLSARLHGPEVDIAELAIPVLDGRLVLNELALRRTPQGWSGSGAAVIEPISMPLLTTAVGLPEMAGVLSAALPGLTVAPGELALDGALVISVFDGYLRVTELRVFEPFGIASRLYSDVEARNIDLEQLTRTFAFGSITGFVDADIRGLELAQWRPLRFDARIGSSPGRYPRRISQRAVQNIGSLAGPGAGVALQRSVLSFFETFGYREIGLSCRLEGNVCIMGGIGDSTTGSFDIVRGGGIPALNVIGYNRHVDWRDLIERLQRVIESNTAPVIR